MFARFFVDRPVFATMLSLAIVLVGLVALRRLPIAQYPEVAPPTIQVSTIFPGANAKAVAESVAAPIEQEVNGVENMLYMLSKTTNDGQYFLDVTFEVGTNLDDAQVLTQNRVAIASAKLPEEVKRQGITVKKKSPMILLCVNVISPDGSRDQLYLSNFATIQMKDALARLPGVGDIVFLGAREYSMRVWLDPDRLASRGITATDVVRALREQNVQVAGGRIGQPPVPQGVDFQYAIDAQGRLLEPEEFVEIIVKTGADGQVTRIRDIGRAELGARNSDISTYLDGMPAVTMALYQLPGANALATAQHIRDAMKEFEPRLPQGVEYRIVYDTTVFIEESVHEVYKTLIEAFVLVFIVVLIFLQDWRATLLPMIDVPVSLIGTFAVMSLFGFSLNNLSLFGLVLAIGIVVDDAIVVVENVERWMSKGLPPREATIKAMDEITGPVIAITLVLSSVFIPAAFLTGIVGQFYRQFALTIATATIISAINAMTMAPARAVSLIKPHSHGHREALPRAGFALVVGLIAVAVFGDALTGIVGSAEASSAAHGVHAGHASVSWTARALAFAAGAAVGWASSRVLNNAMLAFFDAFNRGFERVTDAYGRAVAWLVRAAAIALICYVAMLGLTVVGFRMVPVGFLPALDKGYLIVNVQLPDGASLERTEDVMRHIDEIAASIEGVAHTISVPGYSILTRNNISNSGGMFVILDSFEERVAAGRPANVVLEEFRARAADVQEAQITAFGAPPVDGLASTGAFKLFIQDRSDLGYESLQGTAGAVIEAASEQSTVNSLFTSFRATQPQLYVEVDRTKAKTLGVALNDVFETLQIYLGSAYANDFTRFGRNWQVNVQADASFRVKPEDIGRLRVRNKLGEMVPLSTLVKVRDTTGPTIVNRYNMFPAADLSFGVPRGVGSGDGIATMEKLVREHLPASAGYEWTEIVFQQKLAGGTGAAVFLLGALLVFMILGAQYESWSMPLAVILIVPTCLLAAITGIWIVGSDINLFTQIGFLVLIGLAAKNAILIVEFAKQLEDEGMARGAAVVEAARVRLRPILMTSFAFIFGVVPLLTSAGAGSEMRFAIGIAVFSGMIGVTVFGVFLTPVFYSVIRNASEWRAARVESTRAAVAADPPPVHEA